MTRGIIWAWHVYI